MVGRKELREPFRELTLVKEGDRNGTGGLRAWATEFGVTTHNQKISHKVQIQENSNYCGSS